MTFDALGDVNWPAVVVAGVAYFILGGIWYAPPVLGKPWMRATGMTPEQAGGEGGGPGPAIFVAPLLGYLVSAIATAMLAEATGTDSISEGLTLGLVVGLGYAAVFAAVTATFSVSWPKPWTWFWITASYNLLGLLITGAILGAMS